MVHLLVRLRSLLELGDERSELRDGILGGQCLEAEVISAQDNHNGAVEGEEDDENGSCNPKPTP